MKRAAYRIEYSPETERHFRALTARDAVAVLDIVPRQLRHEPTVETRHRKPLEGNPVAPWELRIGRLRVYFDVEERPERVVDVADATTSLSEYAMKGLKEAVVVTREGKPVLAVTPIRNGDWESIALAANPTFLAIIERSRASQRAGTGISTEEMRRRLGLDRGGRVSKTTSSDRRAPRPARRAAARHR